MLANVRVSPTRTPTVHSLFCSVLVGPASNDSHTSVISIASVGMAARCGISGPGGVHPGRRSAIRRVHDWQSGVRGGRHHISNHRTVLSAFDYCEQQRWCNQLLYGGDRYLRATEQQNLLHSGGDARKRHSQGQLQHRRYRNSLTSDTLHAMLIESLSFGWTLLYSRSTIRCPPSQYRMQLAVKHCAAA